MENHNELKANLLEYEYLFKHTTLGKIIWRVAIYVRLSKEDGKSVSLSIVNQIKRIARFLREFEIVDIYIDDGKTGTDFDRSDYLRLEDDVVNKSVNCIIVKDLTRYSRNIADGIKALDDFVLKHKIRFISLGLPEIDTYKDPTAISSAEVCQALTLAEDYARVTSKKVRDIKEIKREEGERNGGFPPYGYLPNPDGLNWLYDPVAGEIKKKMYLWSAEGMSDREIAKKLNIMGIPNPTAYKKSIGLKCGHSKVETNSGLWWSATVKHILEDKTNICCSVQGKTSSFDHKQIPKKKEDYVVVADCHEKTVSDELFNKVAQARSTRSRVTKTTGKVHMFANLVYCANCKMTMKKNNTYNRHYLVCKTYNNAGEKYCTAKRSISFEKLEAIVLKTIPSQIALVGDLQSLVKKINQQPVVHKESLRIKQLLEKNQIAIDKAERLLDASYYDWKNDDISKEQYQRVKNETEKKLEQLRASLHVLLVEQQKIASGINANNEYFERFLKYRNIESLDRLMLVELISKIYVDEDKTVEIEFNFNNQYLLILDFIEQNKPDESPQKRMTKK